MEERLGHILSIVNEWLKFAEAKNAALLAANTAIIFAVLRVLDSKTICRQWLSAYLLLGLLLLAAAAFIALVSFIPQVRIPWLALRRQPSSRDNLLFYGDIAYYDPTNYLQALGARTTPAANAFSSFEQDYAVQIVTNSRIALRKYVLFSAAIWLTLTAVLSLPVAIVIYGILRSAREG